MTNAFHSFKERILNFDLVKYSYLFFFVSVLITFQLWFSYDPGIPRVPILGPATIDSTYCLFDFLTICILFTLLALSFLKPEKPIYLAGGIVFLLFSWALDLNRMYAIVYYYFCIWSCHLFSNYKKTIFKPNLVIILAAVYFWSGFHKFNIHYFKDSFQWMMDVIPGASIFRNSQELSLLTCLIECLSGWLLLFNFTRKIAVIILLMMHFVILYYFAYSEFGANEMVWNVFSIMALLTVYYEKFSWKEFIQKTHKLILVFIFAISFLFPILFCFDKMNGELAFTMYSGRNIRGEIIVFPENLSRLPSRLKLIAKPFKGAYLIDMDELGHSTYQSELNKSEFVYTKMFYKIADLYLDSGVLALTKYPIQDSAIYEYVKSR